MEIDQFAYLTGRATRNQLEDEMKRRMLMRQVENLNNSNPGALQALVGGGPQPAASPASARYMPTTMGGGDSGGNGVMSGPGGPFAPIDRSNMPMIGGAPTAAGTPAGTGTVLSVESPASVEARRQQNISAENERWMRESYPMLKALQAKNDTMEGYDPEAWKGKPAAAVDDKAAAKTDKERERLQKSADSLQMRINKEEFKENRAILERQLGDVQAKLAALPAAGAAAAGAATSTASPKGWVVPGQTDLGVPIDTSNPLITNVGFNPANVARAKEIAPNQMVASHGEDAAPAGETAMQRAERVIAEQKAKKKAGKTAPKGK